MHCEDALQRQHRLETRSWLWCIAQLCLSGPSLLVYLFSLKALTPGLSPKRGAISFKAPDCGQSLWVMLNGFCTSFFLSFLFWFLLPTHCGCRGLLLDLIILIDTQALVRTPLDEWSIRRRDNAQHSLGINIHATGGIRTRNPSKRAAADPTH
jgi:hypothetical protein